MKHILSLLCVIAISQTMEQPIKSRLNFLMDSEFHVIEYSAENMDYYVQPPQFIGKKFFGMISLDEFDKAIIVAAFNQVVQTDTTAKVRYTSKSYRYSATISLLNKPSGAYDFFVKIKPLKK